MIVVAIAILLSGLFSLPMYVSASAANAFASPVTNATAHVIIGDTLQHMKFEGLTKDMQPWENGIRTNPMPGTFEWWYFQGAFN
ncbi:MAG TPA: hypothetical protein VH500_13635 [Nitrososphaeraceae archaeon]|jgi:hypothetical protein